MLKNLQSFSGEQVSSLKLLLAAVAIGVLHTVPLGAASERGRREHWRIGICAQLQEQPHHVRISLQGIQMQRFRGIGQFLRSNRRLDVKNQLRPHRGSYFSGQAPGIPRSRKAGLLANSVTISLSWLHVSSVNCAQAKETMRGLPALASQGVPSASKAVMR